MTFLKNYLFAFLSGILLYLSWPPFEGSTALIFIALVPLLFIWKYSDSSKRVYLQTFIAFIIFNALSSWWVANASLFGAILAILLNATLMSLPWVISFQLKKYIPIKYALFSLASLWLGYEYFHLRWDFSWPWFNLGNVFATQPHWVQWYEYTGTFGGTAWILLVNCLLFIFIDELQPLPILQQFKKLSTPILALALPLIVSSKLYNNYKVLISPCKVVVVQPNIDPYTDKFDGMSMESQLERLLRLSDTVGAVNTEFFLWPETALHNVYEDRLFSNPQIVSIREFLKKYKNGNVLTGASGYLQYNDRKTSTARTFSDGSCCYDAFNTAILIENSNHYQLYHKSKLVPGVEQIPYPKFFSFLESLAPKLGGVFGSLGTSEKPIVFYSQFGIGTAPIICYESIYGEYVNEFVKSGAQFISIITNDGWWKNTDGYKQHFHYARLRAIETRRDVARSANTGISGFINQRGDIIKSSAYNTTASLSHDINLNDKMTFYVEHGDYIGVISAIFAAASIIWWLIKKWRN